MKSANAEAVLSSTNEGDPRPSKLRSVYVVVAAFATLALLLLAIGAGIGMVLQAHRTPDKAAVRLSEAEIGFAQDMATHHTQAVVLAQSLPADVSSNVRALADQISVAQTKEIGMMHGWLTLYGLPLTSTQPMSWMHAPGGDIEHAEMGMPATSAQIPLAKGEGSNLAPMPGMASWAEVDALRYATGTAGEILFLQLMIRHHQGGIDMARAALERCDSEPITRVALGMINDQGREAGAMVQMLDARDAAPLPYP